MATFPRSRPHVFLIGMGAFAAASSAGGQNAPATEQLLAQIEALAARVEQLEEAAAEASTVTAPFEVKAADGRVLFVVEEESGSAVLRLYDPSGQPAVEATAAAGGEGEVLVGQETRLAAAISADAEGGSFDVFFNGNKVATVNGEEGAGSIELRDGIETVGTRLGAEAGGTGFIELLRDGEQVAARLESGEETGLRINAESGEAAAVMSVDGEGHGSFDVMAGDGKLASMSGLEGGGSVIVRDDTGAPGAWLGAITGGLGFMHLYQGEQLAVELDTAEGAVLRLHDPSGAVGVEANVTPQGEGGVLVAKQGNIVASMAVGAEGQGSFDVLSEAGSLATMNSNEGNGTIVLRDGSGAAGVMLTSLPGGIGSLDLLEGDEVAVQLGGGASGNPALRIFNGGNQVAAIGRSPNNDGGALRIFGGGGEPRVSLDSLASGGALDVYAASGASPVAAVTVTESGGNGVVAIYNT